MKALIAVDSSPSSERVLEEVAARPWPAGTSFSVIHVVDVQGFSRFPVLIEDAKREGDRTVREGVEKISRCGHTAVPEVILGFARRAISEHAKEWHADLIMVGSHGHGAIGRFLLGTPKPSRFMPAAPSKSYDPRRERTCSIAPYCAASRRTS